MHQEAAYPSQGVCFKQSPSVSVVLGSLASTLKHVFVSFRFSFSHSSQKGQSKKVLFSKGSLTRWTGMNSCEIQFRHGPSALWMKDIEPDVNRIKGLCICNFNSVLLRCHYGDGEHTCSFVCLWFLQAFVINCHGTFKYTPCVICWFSSSFLHTPIGMQKLTTWWQNYRA